MLAATIQSSRATAALKAFYTEGKRLNIERISGQLLPMSHCYINLAVVKRSLEVDENHQSFSLTSRLKLQVDEDTDIIPLPSLFEPRTGSSQTPSVPKRILIEGRAGIGKTTLCKKIVYDHLHHQMWSHLFDWLLWVPLRKLRRRSETTVAYNLENMFYDEYFSQQPDGKDLARALWQTINDPSLSNRVLFLLDGLDEISREWDTDTPMHDFVSHLLKQPQAIITTRRRRSDQIDLGTVDLELETIGFLPDQGNNYINHPEIVPDGGTAKEIVSLLEKHTLMQSLMRIPIQLDALCYSWKRDLLEGRSQTMTSIYEAIVLKLWRKDILQLDIRDNQGMRLTEGRVKDIFESDIEDYMFNEIIESRLKDRKSFYNLFKRHGEKRPHDGERVLRKVSILRTSDDTLQTNEQSPTAEIERILLGDIHHEGLAFRRYTARALFQRFLSQNAIQDLVLLLRHRIEGVIRDSVEALKAAVDLPENVIQNLMSLFRDDKIVYRKGTPAPLLAPQNTLSDSTIRSLGTHLKDSLSCVRYRAAAALEVKKTLLPDCIIHNLVQLLEDESSSVQSAACKALCAQKSLPKEVLFDIIRVLNKRAEVSRDGFLNDKTEHAIKILRSQPALPDDIRHALSLLLKEEASCTRFAAGWALASQDNLSDETLNSMGLLLEEPNVNLEQLRRTFRFFEQQKSLRQIGLRAFHRRLKDHNSEVRDLAAYELGAWLPLSDEILHDLVLCLKDPDTRWSAEITLGKHSAIPNEIIQSFHDLLMDEDPEVRDSAAAALDSQKELPSKLLHSLVFVLSHCQDGSACAATNWLKRQRRLPGDITKALAMLLDNERWVVKNNAMTVLLEQSHLAENVLHDIAMLQFYPRIKYRYAWSSRLSSRSDLPPKTVKALAALLEKDNCSHVGEVLRVQSCFYPLVPTLSRQALKNLFRCWIPLAFDMQICCFFEKGKLIMDGPKGRFELDFESDQQREQFIEVIRQVQMDLGFPTAGTSSDEQSPVPSEVTRKRSAESAGVASVLDAPLVSECKPGVVSRFRCLEHPGRILLLATIAILIQVCRSHPSPCLVMPCLTSRLAVPHGLDVDGLPQAAHVGVVCY
jgi:HEAT repeat protein